MCSPDLCAVELRLDLTRRVFRVKKDQLLAGLGKRSSTYGPQGPCVGLELPSAYNLCGISKHLPNLVSLYVGLCLKED